MPKVTIREVARACGVSPATVSKVLNGYKTGTSEATRARVRAAAERLGYRADPHARNLPRGLHYIGISYPNHVPFPLEQPYHYLLQDALRGALSDGGYRLVLGHEDWGPAGDAAHPWRTQVEAVVLLETWAGDLRSRRLDALGLPHVAVGKDAGNYWVDVDNRGGIQGAVEHLLGLGHRDIAFLAGDAASFAASERLAGAHQALAAATQAQLHVLPSDFTEVAGYRSTQQALRTGLRFSALIGVCDRTAVGALMALADAGLRVPEDVSVVGFDDLVDGERYQLTTIRQPLARVAEEITGWLAGDRERLRGGLILPVELVRRASAGPVR
ncbi:MAG TPA: LacI family DNA-binding transcriptional regulator [Limnochordia bacterium]|nr:LacI family DNA-binding transcriptional regulator [Limnochordia bacterium]